MIGFILLIILCAGSWTLFGIGVKKGKDWAGILGMIFGMITVPLLMVSAIFLATKPSEAEDFRNDREYKQELVYAISDNMSPQTVNNIIVSATYCNEQIERNQRHCNSKMWGFMYNKEIAEVKPIDIPKLKYHIIIEE